MATTRRDQGTGGRGSTGQLEDFDLADFEVVPDEEALNRSRIEPSKYQPLVDLARENLGMKIERKVAVMENGEAKRDENGAVVKEPVTYSKAEAEAYVAELDKVRSRSKLPAKSLSMRILTDPTPLDKAPDDARIRVQFYITRFGRKSEGDQ